VRYNSVIARILPFMEQDNIFRAYDMIGMGGTTGTAASSWYYSTATFNPPVGAVPASGRYGCAKPDIKNLLCPSANEPGTATNIINAWGSGIADQDYRGGLFGHAAGSTNYTVNFANWGAVPNAPTLTGHSNYVANMGQLFVNGSIPRNTGTFVYDNKRSAATSTSTVGTPAGQGRSLISITDGTSNTIMFMETNNGYIANFQGQTGWTATSWGSALYAADYGMCPNASNPNCDPVAGPGRGFGWALPSSNHANNRIMTSFADGSVRGMNPTMPFNVFLALSGASDGIVVTID
jgi:hypothetical protein